jgi:phospholipid/cholesterol/gamma-HCH transport system substrate-binding protein
MRGISTELKVGAFALAVLIVLAFMTFKVGGLEWARKKGHTAYVYFNNIAGLDEKTRVKIAGVDSGVIEKIDLSEGRAKVRLRLDPEIKIYKDAVASVKTTGLLGDKFLDIQIGGPEAPVLRDGETITNVRQLVDMDDLARSLIAVSNNFTGLAKSLNEVLGTEETKRSLSRTITNLGEITANLNQTITVNDTKLRAVLDNINNLTTSINTLVEKNSGPLTSTVANMRDFSGSLKSNGPELVENLNKATKELRSLVEENRPGIKQTVDSFGSIAEKIDRGEGSLGKLVKDDRLYESFNKAAEGINKTISAVDRFRTFITFQTEYLTKAKDGKGYFYVTLKPTADKYYILGVVGDPVANVSSKETRKTVSGVTTVTEEDVIKKKIEFTAQFAKRFGDTAVRIGLTENSFGLGGDYFFNNDKGRVTVDAWDFSKDEKYSKNPHVKAGVEYFVFKNLFLSAGADNIFNKKWRGGYIGAGVSFEDEDFKYLFSTLPRIPTK